MTDDAGTSAGNRPLAGRVIALPETRELDRLAELLEAEGARAWRCPLVTILDAPAQAPVVAWLEELLAGGLTDVVFLTGEGLRRLVGAAERMERRDEVVAALGRVRKITRGPKPARALKELGLGPDLAAAVPTSRGIMDELGALDLRGRKIGVQLYGEEPSLELRAFIEAAGAQVLPVAPYIYAPASDAAKVIELVGEMAAGRVDVIAFTSASQVDRLFDVAKEHGVHAALDRAWPQVRVAAIGPIAVETLRRHGIEAAIVPERAYVMKRLVAAIVTAVRDKAGTTA
ncbi:MAG TPA: uroporphyrinogen-III synthase [Polyangia bacterium]|jgi:uroporphyrinogen-III synthase